MTAIRSEIRRVTRHGSPAFNCTVAVESVRWLSTGYQRVAVRGDGLAAYGDVLPADAFKIMIPDGGPVALPQRAPTRSRTGRTVASRC